MKQLTEQELDSKIKSFLTDRLNAHPELANSKVSRVHDGISETVVSRVKSLTKKFQPRTNRSQTYYQV